MPLVSTPSAAAQTQPESAVRSHRLCREQAATLQSFERYGLEPLPVRISSEGAKLLLEAFRDLQLPVRILKLHHNKIASGRARPG